MSNVLSERAVLMRFSLGLPGQHRKDKKTTQKVKQSEGLGENAGKWITDLYPEGALDAVKKKQTEARSYHNKVTFPFGCRSDDDEAGTPAISGIGILPACMIMEYNDTMRRFRGEMERLADDFLSNPQQWVDWAVKEHNGTFDPKNYPGRTKDELGNVQFDPEEYRKVMRKKFYLRSEPLPVPDAEQFSANVSALLGTDIESVNIRVADSGKEAQRELMRRLMEPVRAMAAKLVEEPKPGKKDVVYRDTLIENIKEIADLAPKLNLFGDAQIDAFIAEVASLGNFSPDDLRKDKALRSQAGKEADAIAKKMAGYKL